MERKKRLCSDNAGNRFFIAKVTIKVFNYYGILCIIKIRYINLSVECV